jgi:hypothetical protein
MSERELSRRRFLQGIALAAGISVTGSLASACAPILGLGTDSAYFALDRRQRAVSLISGRIPDSWKTLAFDELMPRLESEIASAVLPEVSAILGGDSREIASRLEYETDEEKLLELVQNYGESNSLLASEVAKESIGVTVSRFSETRAVPDKRIAINLTKIRELGQADLVNAKLASQPEASTRLNTYIVQSAVDAVIHEATHYTMEVDRLPQAGDLARVQAMYAGGAIGTVEFQRLLYYEGVQLAFISRGGYKYYLNKALTEIFRSYVMQRLLAEMESGDANPPPRFQDSVYQVDGATNEVMDFLHAQMGIISPAPPIAVFKNDLLRLIDFYQNPQTIAGMAASNRVRLEDTDFVRIFGLMESLYSSIITAISESAAKMVMPAEMIYRAKLEIEKVVIEARRRTS